MSTSPFPGTGRALQGSPIPAQTADAGRREAMGGGAEQMHFVTRSRGVCVCRGKGCLGVWVHLLPLPASAGSLCTHGWQGPKGTAHGSLDFYPAVQTGRRQIRVSVGISSCQQHPQPLWAGIGASSLCPSPSAPCRPPSTAGEFGRCTFHPHQDSVPLPTAVCRLLLADNSDAQCCHHPTPCQGRTPLLFSTWKWQNGTLKAAKAQGGRMSVGEPGPTMGTMLESAHRSSSCFPSPAQLFRQVADSVSSLSYMAPAPLHLHPPACFSSWFPTFPCRGA